MRYMMTSDVKTNLPSLINHQRSDMFSIDNISSLKMESNKKSHIKYMYKFERNESHG